VTQLILHRFLEIDPASAVPIWRQIEDGMRRLVASERLAPGSVVPSVRELARALRVNPATVSKAYRRLTEAGLLTVPMAPHPSFGLRPASARAGTRPHGRCSKAGGR
jgi:GntR family transcriptional regulator